MASARTPSLRSCSTSRSAPRLVRTNTRVFSEFRQMAAHTLTRSIWCTSRNRCSMASTVVLGEATSWRTGSVRYRLTSRSTAPSRVAENSSVWWSRSRRRSTHSTWGMNPMSAMRSASSSTRVSMSATDSSPRSPRSISRPGRGDDHVHAPAELLDLALDVRPAVDGDDPEPGLVGQGLEHLADLDGQLTGGDEHQGPGPARLGGPGRHGALEQRDAEGQGLARAGLGLAADVAPGQGVGHGHGLDGEGGGDPLGGQGLDQGGVDAEGGEGAGRSRPRRPSRSSTDRGRDPTDR